MRREVGATNAQAATHSYFCRVGIGQWFVLAIGPSDARRLVSGQAQRDKFRRQIGAPGRDDDELLAVQHVGYRRSRRVAWQRHFSNNLPGRLVVGAEFWVVDLEVRHRHGSRFAALHALGAALLPDDEQRLRQEEVTARGSPEGTEA